uniref:Uncharacterized protein n=1 Tax=Corvus moneduloides TaxID=1196302 RepID=A0A8U7NM73_CORMO
MGSWTAWQVTPTQAGINSHQRGRPAALCFPVSCCAELCIWGWLPDPFTMSCSIKRTSSTSYRSGGGGGGGACGGSSGRSSSVSCRRYASSVIGGGSYGGAACGGYGGSLSMGSLAGGFGGGFAGSCGPGGDLLLSGNEKVTMQNLNDRLAAYLDKVRRLEEENAQLEHHIREWYRKQAPSVSKDYSSYYQTIEQLQNQIISATVDNNRMLLDIDNSKMTADDFRMKYENELVIRQTVEADINGLRNLMDDLTLVRSSLESELESLKDELIALKRNHEEEMRQLQSQTGGDVSVEVNAAPGEDLTKTLNDLRNEYEEIIARNRKEVEQWYEVKIQEVNQQVTSSSQDIQTSSHQLTELRREMQNLEIELQAQLSTVRGQDLRALPSLARAGSHRTLLLNSCVCPSRKALWKTPWQKLSLAMAACCNKSRGRSTALRRSWPASAVRWRVRARSTRCSWASRCAWNRRSSSTGHCCRRGSRILCTFSVCK